MAEIISALYPDVSSITPEYVQAVRQRIVLNTLRSFPNLETRPGSVHGDLSISPDAMRVASIETGLNGILGDLDMDNVAAGVVYSCDFVNQYLRQLGVVDRPTGSSTGKVRMFFDRDRLDKVFSDNAYEPLSVSRGLQFLFGEDNVFRLQLSSEAAALLIYPPGSSASSPGSRVVALVDTSTYAVDVPVVGVLATAVTAGATAALDVVVPALTSAVALVDFSDGNPSTTLAQRAKMALSLFHASSLGTRGGAVGFVLRMFPDASECSPTVSGDQEMARDKTNVLGIADGRLDVNVRSVSGLMEDSLTVELPYVTDSGKSRFLGPVVFPSIPSYVRDIVAADAPTLSIYAPEDVSPKPYLLSYSSNSAKGVMGGVARSAYESFVLGVDQVFDGLDPKIPVLTRDGRQYGRFTITYRFDPLVRGVHEIVSDSSNAPVGVDVLARAFVPIVVSSMDVRYFRQTATTINVGLAKNEILSAVAAASYPTPFTTSLINDALLYAGATGLQGFVATAKVLQSAATYYMKPGVAVPDSNAALDSVLAAGVSAVPVDILSDAVYGTFNTGGSISALVTGDPIITNAETLRPKTTDGSRYTAYGPRNIMYVLDPADLTLTEAKL